MEGHAEMDMSVGGRGPLVAAPAHAAGFTATAELLRHGLGGGLARHRRRPADRRRPRRLGARLVLAGRSSSSIIRRWRRSGGRSSARAVAIISFVCSIGNVPLAAVLWNGGISFGGVLAFIFADLIILPILDIYRKYYGWKMASFLLRHLLRHHGRRRTDRRVPLPGARPRPSERNAKVDRGQRDLELHTYLNIVFLALGGLSSGATSAAAAAGRC